MKDAQSPSESSGATIRKAGPNVVPGGSVSGESYTPTLETAGSRSTGTDFSSTGRGHRKRKHGATAPRVRHSCHALFSSCIESLERAIDHDNDFFMRNNALEQMKDTLSELWSVRNKREETFAEIINLLQAVFLGRNVEEFKVDKLISLKRSIEKCRDQSEFDDDFANELTIDLMKDGVDVFRETE